MSGSTRRPVLRPFWASTRKSQGAASGRFLTKARRFGSRRAARKAARISANCSGRWQSRNRPPSRRARRAQSTASAVVQLPVWRASARRGSGLRGPAVKYGGLQAAKSYCPCSGPAVQSCRRSPQPARCARRRRFRPGPRRRGRTRRGRSPARCRGRGARRRAKRVRRCRTRCTGRAHARFCGAARSGPAAARRCRTSRPARSARGCRCPEFQRPFRHLRAAARISAVRPGSCCP